MAENN